MSENPILITQAQGARQRNKRPRYIAKPETDSEIAGNPFQPRQAARESWSGNASTAPAAPAANESRPGIPAGQVAGSRAALGGLHKESVLEKAAA